MRRNDGLDRRGITRNKYGDESPHSLDPELWNIDGTEVDLLGTYRQGTQLWYLACRAIEGLEKDPPQPISGTPMNKKAEAAGRLFANN